MPFDFRLPESYPLGSYTSPGGNPAVTRIGDVTGDGRDDVVMLTAMGFGDHLQHRAFIYEQTTAGTLKPPVSHYYPTGLYTRASNLNTVGLELADLNVDGTDDIVIGFAQGIAIMLATGGGGFSIGKHPIAAEYRLPDDPIFQAHSVSNVVVTDVDRDGRLDIVAHNYLGATLLFGDGNGGIAETVAMDPPYEGITDVKVGDATGDGFEDVVVLAGARPTRRFWILPNTGTRGFGAPRIQGLVDDETYSSIEIGDWDLDGVNEIIVALHRNSTYATEYPAKLLVHERSQSGEYVLEKSFTTYDLPLAMLSADIDGDRRVDLLIDHHGWEAIGFYAGGKGFDVETLFPIFEHSSTSRNTAALSSGDVDGDGCADVAWPDMTYGLVVMRGMNCKRPALPVLGGRLPADIVSGTAAAARAPTSTENGKTATPPGVEPVSATCARRKWTRAEVDRCARNVSSQWATGYRRLRGFLSGQAQ